MSEMKLIDSYRSCAPTIGDPAVDAPRQDAMATLYGELRRLAPKVAGSMGVDPRCAEDVLATILTRLIQTGPRGVRPGDPTDDQGVRNVLARAIRNGVVSDWRERRRLTSLDANPDDRPPSPHLVSDPPDPDLAKMREFRRAAANRLFGEILDRAADQAPDWFRDAIDDRRAIAEGRTTIPERVERRFGHVDKRTRNRFDQQQHRALKRLGAEVERAIRAGDPEGHALRSVLTSLEERELYWSPM